MRNAAWRKVLGTLRGLQKSMVQMRSVRLARAVSHGRSESRKLHRWILRRLRSAAHLRSCWLNEEVDANEIDPEGEAHALRRRLNAAVQAHWHQLIEAKVI